MGEIINAVYDLIPGSTETYICCQEFKSKNIKCVICCSKTVCKFLAQLGITFFLVQWIGYISYILKLGYRRLVGPSPVVDTNTFSAAGCPIKAGCWEKVGKALLS